MTRHADGQIEQKNDVDERADKTQIVEIAEEEYLQQHQYDKLQSVFKY